MMIGRYALRCAARSYFSSKVHRLRICNIFCMTAGNANKGPNYIFGSFSTSSCYVEKDPAPYFFNDDVQNLLKKLTGLNIEKVFKNSHLNNPELVEDYKFYTKEDLADHMEQSLKEAERLLQMPPVLQERKPILEVLSYDPALQSPKVTSKLVVADISYGISDRNRIVVVRDPDGTLRQASWEERARMNEIYNPRIGRSVEMPLAFKEENLQGVLDQGNYLFILDYSCAHFEPDELDFHRVTSQVYEHINKLSKFEDLYSTRHFGPMCFYLAWNRNIDSLLVFYINRERVDEAIELIRLYYFINDKSKFVRRSDIGNDIDFIKTYANEESKGKSSVLLAIQAYQELVREREANRDAVKSSHGLS